jgi:hypothetical protein
MAAPSGTGATASNTTRLLGTPPEPYDGAIDKAEAFWTNLDNYYYLNTDSYTDLNKRIASALTHFKLGTAAGEWAKDRQKTALAASPITFGTWENFRDAFKQQFIPGDQELLAAQKMHTLRMGTRPFSEWYQEWSTHASRSGANDATKMYAFRQNIPIPLHNKILRVTPSPTTLECLAALTKEFDQVWRIYGQQRDTPNSRQRRPNIRSSNPEDPDPANVALANFPPTKKYPKLTQEQRDQRRKEGRCLYCGEKGHWADRCPVKPRRSRPTNSNYRNNPPRTRATEIDRDRPESPPPTDPPPTVSHLYTIPEHHFDLSHPDPDLSNLDF